MNETLNVNLSNKICINKKEISQYMIKQTIPNLVIKQIDNLKQRKQQASIQNILIYSNMAKTVNSPLSPSMQLLTVSNKITKPQDGFVFCHMSGVDKDGETIKSG